MASAEPEFVPPLEHGESLASLLEALDRENAELRERLVSVGADAARKRAELELTRNALGQARTEAQEALANIRRLAEERDRERSSAMTAQGARDALRAAFEERSRVGSELEARIRELESELHASRQQERAAGAQREVVEGQLVLVRDRVTASEERAGALEKQLRVAHAGLAGQCEESERLRTIDRTRKQQLARAKSRSRRFEDDLKALRSSRSYRVIRIMWRLKSALLLGGLRARRAARQREQAAAAASVVDSSPAASD